MKEDLILLARSLVTKLNSILTWEADARIEFMEYFIKTVCAEKLPSTDGKQDLLERAAMWDIACRAVSLKHYTSKEAIEIEFLIDWIGELMIQISTMKCGT